MRKRLSVRSREILFEKGLKEGKNLATGKTKRKTKRTCHAEYLNFRSKVSYILNVKHHQKQSIGNKSEREVKEEDAEIQR